MSAWVEVHVKGNRRAYIQASAVVGVVMEKGAAGDQIASENGGLTLILQGGETLPDVIGLSADDVILRCDGARTILRRAGMESVVCRLDEKRLEAFFVTLNDCMGAERGGAS